MYGLDLRPTLALERLSGHTATSDFQFFSTDSTCQGCVTMSGDAAWLLGVRERQSIFVALLPPKVHAIVVTHEGVFFLLYNT